MVSANEFFIGMLNLFLIARFARVLFQRFSALCVVQSTSHNWLIENL